MGSFFGLDIGSSEIKVLKAKKHDQGYELDKFARVDIKEGQDQAEVIKQAVEEAGIRATVEVNVALPESDVYTRIVTTPQLSETELSSSIQYEVEQYVPVPMEEVELFHQVLEKSSLATDEKEMKVLLIAVTKKRLKELTDLLDKAQLIPKSLETELFSLQRVFMNSKKIQLIISFNHKTTDMIVLNKGVPLFLNSMAVGAGALTKVLVNELNLSVDQAEQYKRTYGLRTDLLEGKVAVLIKPLVDEVVGQINKALIYLSQQGINKKPDQLVITGGGAMLPGLSSYLVKAINMEVVVGNPLEKFVKSKDLIKKIGKEESPYLATVLGLAIKGL